MKGVAEGGGVKDRSLEGRERAGGWGFVSKEDGAFSWKKQNRRGVGWGARARRCGRGGG